MATAEGKRRRTRQTQTFAVVSQFFHLASELLVQDFGRAAAPYVASRALGAGHRTNGSVIGICSWYRLWCGTPEIESLNEISGR